MKALQDSQLAIRVNVTLDRESKRKMEKLAKARDSRMTVSGYLRLLIEEETRREERRKR